MNNIDQYLDSEASKSLNKIKVEMDNNIKENNKLIAKFMGLVFSYRNEVLDCDFYYTPEEYKQYYERHQVEISPIEMMYDESWDWLMPVVERIMDLDEMEKGVGFKIAGGEVFVGIMNPNRIGYKIAIHHSNFDGINDVWNACVKFIKWYNEQNK